MTVLPIVTLGAAAGTAQQRQPGSSALSDHALFEVSIAALAPPVAINVMHAWVLHIATPGGRPVEDATVSIAGAIPDRGHRLPTAPLVTRYLGGGRYLAEGMKFHMAGDWRLTLAILAGRRRDTVSFDIVVR